MSPLSLVDFFTSKGYEYDIYKRDNIRIISYNIRDNKNIG